MAYSTTKPPATSSDTLRRARNAPSESRKRKPLRRLWQPPYRWPHRRRRWIVGCANFARPSLGVGRLRPSIFRFAIAAAFALVFLGLGVQTLLLHQRLAAEDVALVTIVHSHFNHVSMSPKSSNPVAAKILYARDGSWIYIIADKPESSLRAVAGTAAGTVDLGALKSAGETATLLAHPPRRVRSITLQRHGANVATAKLVY